MTDDWLKYDIALSKFCFRVVNSSNRTDEIVSSIVGEDTDWLGISSLPIFTHSVLNLKNELFNCHNSNNHLDRQIKYQEQTSKEIINQLKQANKLSQDNEWQLQETLAHSENLLKIEIEKVKSLKENNELLIERINEVESFLNSDQGELCLHLEEELAIAKLRIAELESDKDEVIFNKNNTENIPPNRQSVLKTKDAV